MGKTKLELTSYEELNKMGADEMAKTLKNALKSTYMKLDALHYRGYEDNDYNKKFRDMMGETRAKAVKKVDDLAKAGDFGELKRLTFFTKRHMSAEVASVKGMEAKEKRGFLLLEKLFRGLTPGDEFTAPLKRERKKGKGTLYETEGFRLKKGETDLFLTHKELNDIWKIIRKIDEMQSLKTLRDDSGQAITAIFKMIVSNRKLTALEIYNELKAQKLLLDLEEARKAEEYEKKLEEAKGGRRRWSTRA